jgi:hypothetical protein
LGSTGVCSPDPGGFLAGEHTQVLPYRFDKVI